MAATAFRVAQAERVAPEDVQRQEDRGARVGPAVAPADPGARPSVVRVPLLSVANPAACRRAW